MARVTECFVTLSIPTHLEQTSVQVCVAASGTGYRQKTLFKVKTNICSADSTLHCVVHHASTAFDQWVDFCLMLEIIITYIHSCESLSSTVWWELSTEVSHLYF